MMNYNNNNITQCLRQYDMFANSLNLVKSNEEKNMIINQLTKLEKKIISLTNEIYEKEYNELYSKESYLMNDERDRLSSLVELINKRISYIEKRNNNHYKLTGEVIDIGEVQGTSILEDLEERINIIDKYQNNVKLSAELNNEIENLSNKISLAEKKISINESLNIELEKKMIKLLNNAIDKLNLSALVDNKEEYEKAFYEAEKCQNLARQNLEIAKTSPVNMLSDCQKMYQEVTDDYYEYKEKICLIKLIETYSKETNDYNDLLIKRKEMNELLKNIRNKEFNMIINNELDKQYETIMSEIKDIDNYNDLVSEKEDKEAILREITKENNSEKFQDILGELLENERKRQQAIEEERKRLEEEEKQRRIELERKKQEEILRKQKIIEEARKKEIEKRTREMLVEQKHSVLQNKKSEKMSFETIKGISNKDKEEQETEKHIEKNINSPIEPEENQNKEIIEKEEFPKFKNKVDIEKELFAEFNQDKEKIEEQPTEEPIENVERIEKRQDKLPEVSLDDYMNNFKEDTIEEPNLKDLFSEDEFPSIPM